jgi:hypothetical protein
MFVTVDGNYNFQEVGSRKLQGLPRVCNSTRDACDATLNLARRHTDHSVNSKRSLRRDGWCRYQSFRRLCGPCAPCVKMGDQRYQDLIKKTPSFTRVFRSGLFTRQQRLASCLTPCRSRCPVKGLGLGVL